MANSAMLESVKSALGITGTAMDGTLSGYIDIVCAYMANAGVSASRIAASPFIVGRGVNEVWNNDGTVNFSPMFLNLVSQLALIGD